MLGLEPEAKMSYSRVFMILMAAVVATALWMPAQAGVSVGIHGGHKGSGVHVGYRGGHYGHYQRHYRGHGYSGYRHQGYRSYGRHHRGYRYGRYRSYPYRSYGKPSTSPGSRADPYPSEVESTRHETSSGDDTDGWEALTEGEPQRALSIFRHAAKSSPRASVPKAGYALAAASSGNFDRGIWAMRRAFRYQPEDLPELALSTGVHETVNELIAHYEYELDDGGEHPDAAFMIAALNLLNGRPAAAQSASARAAEAGDSAESLRNLERILSSTPSAGSSANGAGDHSDQPSAGHY